MTNLWTWIRRISYVVTAFVLAIVYWCLGMDFIKEHHVLATAVLGLVLGTPLIIWRSVVAAQQLKTSNQIASTANKSRTDIIFANGANMLGQSEPETRWAGIKHADWARRRASRVHGARGVFVLCVLPAEGRHHESGESGKIQRTETRRGGSDQQVDEEGGMVR